MGDYNYQEKTQKGGSSREEEKEAEEKSIKDE